MFVILLLSTLSVCGLTTYTNPSTGDLNSELSCTLVLNMEQISFNQSLKNIPVPDNRTYRADSNPTENQAPVIWKVTCRAL